MNGCSLGSVVGDGLIVTFELEPGLSHTLRFSILFVIEPLPPVLLFGRSTIVLVFGVLTLHLGKARKDEAAPDAVRVLGEVL